MSGSKSVDMTEQEWLDCTEPEKILQFLQGKGSYRKLRLFACAVCRRFFDLLDTQHDQQAIEAGEEIADGKRIRRKYGKAHIRQYDLDLGEEEAYFPALGAACSAGVLAAERAYPENRESEEYLRTENSEKRLLCDLLRDIFGGSFRQVALAPHWLTSTVANLATEAYENRTLPAGELEPARLAVLADALEEAGCTDANILSHCRGAGPHVRGCWVVDLILGKK